MPIGFGIDPQKCTECLRCAMACAVIQVGSVRPAASRIRIEKQWPELPGLRVCRFDDCDGQPCIASCPVEAIAAREGIVRIDAQACTGCEACLEACPHGAIRLDGEGIAFKCDFCGGEPACVAECVTAALTRKGE